MENVKLSPFGDKISEGGVLLKISQLFILLLTLIGLGFIFTAFIMPFQVREFYKPLIPNYQTIADLGPVGDFIGGTTVAFLTASSVSLLLATVIMQRQEIKISQRSIQELVKQTEASVKQADEARKETQITNETMKQQQIESTFFNMLSLHHQIVDGIIFKNKDTSDKNTHTGRVAFEELKYIYETRFAEYYFFKENPDESLKSWLDRKIRQKYREKIFNNTDTITKEDLDEVYKGFHNDYGNIIGHYMRNNYRIVKFIVNNVALDKDEQNRIKEETGREPIIGDIRYYFGTLRTQWSNAEFELILINALYSKNHKFKDLILKYDVLDIKEKTDTSNSLSFKLKDSMDRFKAYRKLIENQV